ncbi:MAG: TonB-dependent receptor [Deltaproteobacteria bacterium]|nr:TonB-dependent receptor [Deltaproteobacteria bacterium]
MAQGGVTQKAATHRADEGRSLRKTGIVILVCAGILVHAERASAHDKREDAEAQRAFSEEEQAREQAKAEAKDAVDVFVSGDRTPGSASGATITGSELKARPKLRPADALQAAGGLIAVQHAGGGKANQYFLRGFDIDHGTDLLLTIDGVPVNLVSHGHGQGYADLNFVIPEVITSLDVYKGSYHTELGDFATAGSVNFRLADILPESFAAASVGQYGILRGVGTVSRTVGDDWRFTVAGEVATQDGPFENAEKYRRMNAYLRATHDLSPSSSVTMTWMSHTGRWRANGQLPARAVASGLIDRFGTLDPTEGGTTQRHIASLRYNARIADDAALDVLAYAQRYDWRLYSNFTFFLDDPVNGDQIEQTDGRWVFGVNGGARLLHRHFGPVQIETRAGLQVRSDGIDNGLFHTRATERLDTRVDAGISQTSLGLYVEERLAYKKWLAVRAGVRVDRLDVSVTDRKTPTGPESLEGSAGDMLASPKLSVVLAPHTTTQLYLNYGRGFHSNDARGATRRTDPATLLVPATTYEVGARVRPWRPLVLTAAAYRIDLDSELVWSGDAGTTEPSEATRRIGLEMGGRLNLNRWLFADVDLTLNRAAFKGNAGNGGAVALAPTRTLSAGIGARAKFGTFGSLRVRHVGERPANEDGSLVAEGFTIVDAQVGHRYKAFEATVDVQNLLNSEWREVQFATTSRLANEAKPVDEVNFTPGWPITVRATLAAYF